jgi:hypothetical protein
VKARKQLRGRKQFAVKKSTLADLPDDQKWYWLRYGEKCDPEALEAVHAIHNSLFTTSTGEGDPCGFAAMYRDEAWAIITKHYRAGWSKNDGSFFQAMANAMEVHMRPVDPVCAFIGSEILDREARKLPLPTAPEMHRRLTEAGIPATVKTVRRHFQYWGRTPTPDKHGPDRGHKRRHLHRAR